MFPKVLSPPAI